MTSGLPALSHVGGRTAADRRRATGCRHPKPKRGPRP